MMHHAYVAAGDLEEGIARALAFAERQLGLAAQGNPDVIVLRYGLLSVEEARKLADLAAQAPAQGDRKIIVVAASRIFHEAQNAMLKLFEEPPAGTTLVLVLPSDGMLLATLRSRVLPLSQEEGDTLPSAGAAAFLAAGKPEREKLIAKLLDRAKSDKDEEKQAARLAALELAKGLEREAYEAYRRDGGTETRALLTDLASFIPILHDRSAPLKPIFEHLLLVTPLRLS